MKKIYTIAFAFTAALFTFSCNNEINEPDSPETGDEGMVKICITGKLDKEVSKTAYDSDGKMTWVDGDRCALIVYHNSNYSDQNRYTYTLEASYGDITEEGRQASFFGMVPQHQDNSDWLSAGYAVYPVAVSQVNGNNYYNAPFIKMPSSVSGLASSIILVGTPDSDTPADVTNFNFKTAMSVLKVNIANIPAEAEHIRLTSNNKDTYPVDGDFTLVKSEGVVTIGIGNYQDTWGNGYQDIDISGEGAIASQDYYFNIPVGTYPANTLSIEVRGANKQVLMKRTIAKDITFNRNECITIPSLLYHRVYVNGSLSAPGLYTVKPSTANTIRVHISNQKLTAANYLADKGNWVNGNRFGGDQNGWNLANLKKSDNTTPFLSAAGTYYLQYIISSDGSQPTSLSDATVMAYGSVPFMYVPSGNKIPVASSWLNVPYVSTDEGAVANLVDGNSGTYWHSPYGSEDPARNATYGQIISIDLNEGGITTDGNFYFSFATRNVQNNHAKAMDIYVSNVRWDDAGFASGKVLVGSTTNALDGIFPSTDKWIKNPIECSGSGSYRYITICILKCGNLDGSENNLTTGSCTHMAEIEFYTK
ncbi:MAG: hypothetical protein J6W74_02015 [Bacteroidales bacterium]|nr:hypothetical protein [Bacteroidales bacterium]